MWNTTESNSKEGRPASGAVHLATVETFPGSGSEGESVEEKDEDGGEVELLYP